MVGPEDWDDGAASEQGNDGKDGGDSANDSGPY